RIRPRAGGLIMDFTPPFGFAPLHLFGAIMYGLFSFLALVAAIAVVFLLVRFLLVATKAAQLYVARHEPARDTTPPTVPAAAVPTPPAPESPTAPEPPTATRPAPAATASAPTATQPKRTTKPATAETAPLTGTTRKP